MTSNTKKAVSPIGKVYLVAYNVFQFLGWSWILILLVRHVLANGLQAEGLWQSAGDPLLIFQTGAILEIMHSAVGLVPTSVGVTLPQVFSRLFVTWPVLYCVAETRECVGFSLLLAAWSITECIRYLFYALGLVGNVPHLLVWCRYSFFVVLYLLGVGGEIICTYVSLAHYKATNSLSILLPNNWNVTFSFYYFIIVFMLAYIPVFPKLYGHMFRQRRKVLGPKKQD